MFYDKFVQLCKQKGVSPSRAAIESGISKSLVTKWRTNKVQDPSAEIARKIAAYFGITVGELLDEDIKKEQTTTNGDLSTKREALMRFAQSVPEDKIDMILQVMQTILANG